MAIKFSEDIVPLTDLKTNPGRVVRQVADSRRPVHPCPAALGPCPRRARVRPREG